MPTLFTSLQSKRKPSERALQFTSFVKAVPQTAKLLALPDKISSASANPPRQSDGIDDYWLLERVLPG